MYKILKSSERGKANHGWLKSFHTFSFADYYNPEAMEYKSLRVINEDFVTPGAGFPTHPHSNMEIISYVVSGQIAHKDSMGNVKAVSAGEVQAMTAGSGVTHSEFNPSDSEPLHLLQIWIKPDKRGYEPKYSEWRSVKSFETDKLQLIASNEGREGSVQINQKVDLYVGKYKNNEKLNFELMGSQVAWVQLIKGKLDVDGNMIEAGDAISAEEVSGLKIAVNEDAEFLVFKFD